LNARARFLPNIEWARCDLANEDQLRRALSGVETVFHCAALAGPPGSLEQYEEANVKGAIRLTKLAVEAGVKNLIYMSSLSVYGLPRGSSRYLEENASYDERAADRGVYTQTKLAAEKALLEYASQHTAPRIIVLRAGAIYGPGAALPIGRFRFPSPNNRPVIAGGRGIPMPLTYVDNLIEAMLASARSEAPTGRVYNVVDSAEVDQGAVARALRVLSGDRIRPMFIPYALAWVLMLGIDLIPLIRQGKLGTARYRLKRTLADMRFPCVAAREELRWQPRVSLPEGLAKVLDAATEIPQKIEARTALVNEPVAVDAKSPTAGNNLAAVAGASSGPQRAAR
jgi:nucleoside-diphosphate-sugar epimerase